MTCSACDVDFVETEQCYIVLEEIDYGTAVDNKRFCSYRCLKEWYGL